MKMVDEAGDRFVRRINLRSARGFRCPSAATVPSGRVAATAILVIIEAAVNLKSPSAWRGLISRDLSLDGRSSIRPNGYFGEQQNILRSERRQPADDLEEDRRVSSPRRRFDGSASTHHFHQFSLFFFNSLITRLSSLLHYLICCLITAASRYVAQLRTRRFCS